MKTTNKNTTDKTSMGKSAKRSKGERITREEAISIIKSGKFCSVSFVKRSDNTTRKLSGRSGVKRYLKHRDCKDEANNCNKKPYNFKEHGLLSFYDIKEAQYKSIPQERIIIVNGKTVI